MKANPDIRRITTLADPEVIELVARSDAYLDALYPPESNHAEPLETLISETSAFFAAYLDDRLVACGAVKVVDDDVRYGEIKRLYVDERARGRGLAVAVMRQLEDHAHAAGAALVRLEAGPSQPEAIGLYRKLGYTDRGPFGAYRPDPLSVFMEKALTSG